MNSSLMMLAAMFLLATIGCAEAGPGSPEASQDVSEIHAQYQLFVSEIGRSPDSADELATFRLSKESEVGEKALKSGNYEVVFSTNFKQGTEEIADKIYIYHVDTPEKGGVVGMVDGTVKVLTKDEFSSAEVLKPYRAPRRTRGRGKGKSGKGKSGKGKSDKDKSDTDKSDKGKDSGSSKKEDAESKKD